ncbi:MAG: radical SAM protein [Candidatus Odinarchaeum yellowstonii]|uniref:Radical SAM protein n=1 Tax=Odinarchaeota yellowstonii (strain LCB_4) TaxID=1841599 RepID=A0AAF0IB98_ODILC|nr:MAG: radical SAM protein [Candidatus Odinarchaeum yellowstonii]
MSLIYGPLPSWRFGRSLGVDATTLPKKCSYSCIYCQLGRTELYVSQPESIQSQLPTPSQIREALEKYLESVELDSIDIVTISGTGEPTLNLSLSEIVDNIRSVIGGKPLGILTNASLIPREDVFNALLKFDFVSAKFDAGDEKAYRIINRPCKGLPSFEEIKNSIKQLVHRCKGVVALETMLLRTSRGFSNIEGEHYQSLIENILDIKPHIVQLYTPWRPAAEDYVQQATAAEIQKAAADLAVKLGREKLWVYGEHDERGKRVKWKSIVNAEKTITELLKRRPCRISDITFDLNLPLGVVVESLKRLQEENKLESRKVDGEVFYNIK